MRNAKEEFVETTKDVKIVWARVSYNGVCFILKKGFSKKDYEMFLNKLDFEYDSGYGSQELEGIIACANGVWFDRGEYDGSEWWEEHKYPKYEQIGKSLQEAKK